jgi:hypothetical protein
VLFIGRHDGVLFTETELETFVDLVAAAEREEIAQLADASVNADQYPTLTMLAQAIRMSGERHETY